MRKALIVGAGISLLAMVQTAHAGDISVAWQMVEDRKSVIGTVEPTRELTARARIGGVVTLLQTIEGQEVTAGTVLAVVADQKLTLQIRGLEARIKSQEAQRDQARADYERMQDLLRRNVGSQTQVDQFKTALFVAFPARSGVLDGLFVGGHQLNHPLAGVELTFDVEIVGARDATAEELSHGHAHGGAGGGGSCGEGCGCH